MKKEVYIYQRQIAIQKSFFGDLTFTLSKYSNCLFIFINQTGSVGSIIEGQTFESTSELADQDYQDSEDIQSPTSKHLFEIRVLFGSTQIEFYELLLRRIMSVIWEELKVEQKFKILLNISLPIMNKNFKQEAYYAPLIDQIKQGLKNVL